LWIHPRMQAKLKFQACHTGELDGGEWSASRPGRFTPGNHWIRDWVGPRTGLDAVAKRKTFRCPFRESNSWLL